MIMTVAIANELQLHMRHNPWKGQGDFMLDVVIDTFIDAVKLLPFLFVTYLVMEYIEHRMGEKAKHSIEKSGRFGPVLGGIIGVFPQCGFSAAASNLYAGRIITLGTLIAIFLSTSDEMLPILISGHAKTSVILQLLGLKVLVGIAAGCLVDLFAGNGRRNGYRHQETENGHMDIGHLCEHEHCGCEEGVVKPAFRHTINIFLFVLLVSFLLNTVIYFAGENFLRDFILHRPVLSHMAAGLVGLIPNCASSVVLTQLYLDGVMGLGTMMSGLLAGTGIGLAVLFRVNDRMGENVKIVLLLYVIGVLAGVLIDLL